MISIHAEGEKKNASGAYFERRLPADVHKQHVVSLQHVLKHLLAGKSPHSRPVREKTHSLGHFNTGKTVKTRTEARDGDAAVGRLDSRAGSTI